MGKRKKKLTGTNNHIYWKELLKHFQELNFDVGGMVLDYLRVTIGHAMVLQEFETKTRCVWYEVKKRGSPDLCLANHQYNSIRELLKIKINLGKVKWYPQYFCIFPIDNIHQNDKWKDTHHDP